MLAALRLCNARFPDAISSDAAAELVDALRHAETLNDAWKLCVDAHIPLRHARAFASTWWPQLHDCTQPQPWLNSCCTSCDNLLTAATYATGDGIRKWCTQCAHGGRV
jgi:hypothetical protein